jgi:hypothetical protein
LAGRIDSYSSLLQIWDLERGFLSVRMIFLQHIIIDFALCAWHEYYSLLFIRVFLKTLQLLRLYNLEWWGYWWVANWVRHGRKWSWPNSRYYPGFCTEVLSKNTKHLCQGSQSVDQDLNQNTSRVSDKGANRAISLLGVGLMLWIIVFSYLFYYLCGKNEKKSVKKRLHLPQLINFEMARSKNIRTFHYVGLEDHMRYVDCGRTLTFHNTQWLVNRR